MGSTRCLTVAATLLAAALTSIPAYAFDGTGDGNPPAQDGSKAGKKPADGAGKEGQKGRPAGKDGMGRRMGAQGPLAQYRIFANALKTVDGSLTPEQKQKVDAARADFEAKVQKFQPAMEELMKKMMEARQSGNADPKAMEALKEEMGALRDSMPKADEFQTAVMAMLNADQQTQVKQRVEAIKKEMAERGGPAGGRPDGKGGPGGKRPGGQDGKKPAGDKPAPPSDKPAPPADKPVDFPE